MAATRLIPLHVNKGKTVARCLADRVDYSQNPEKTEDGKYISSYGCNPETADEEFLLSKRQYVQITGRESKKDVIAYQIRQSFKPGEVTPEEANQIGHELAMRFTKGAHAFIVATHTDQKHIHNHIIFNSTALDCTRKFRDFYFSGIALRRISDLICLEHGLSVIKPKAYRDREKYQDTRFTKSKRGEIREAIDTILLEEPKDFEDFLKRMEREGFSIRREKQLAILLEGSVRPIRFKSLGKGYTEEDIVKRILGDESLVPKSKSFAERINYSLIDIQKKLQEGKGGGYQRWAKVFNVKQTAKTILFLQERGIYDYESLKKLTDSAADRMTELGASIKEKEKRLGAIRALKTHIINYAKTREVYVEYRKSGYSKKFFEGHREELALHKAAKEAFPQSGLDKLPTVKQLNQEFYEILQAKNEEYAEYRKLKDELREYQIARKNMEIVLDIPVVERDRDKERSR